MRHSMIPLNRQNASIRRLKRILRPAFMGTLRRTTPLSDDWGFDRGKPVDRYYIERFLEQHRADIHGRVLEIKDTTYTRRFGEGVERADVLDIDPDNPCATIVADLAAADPVPAGQFDCIVLTQTLHLIYDTRAAIGHARRMLRPGGVLLATLPSLSRIIHGAGIKTDYWRFTAASCERLFGEAFGARAVTVRSRGNVLACVAFLAGMAAEELSERELEAQDDYFPLVVTVRAVNG